MQGTGVVISPPYIRFTHLLGAGSVFFLEALNLPKSTPFSLSNAVKVRSGESGISSSVSRSPQVPSSSRSTL